MGIVIEGRFPAFKKATYRGDSTTPEESVNAADIIDYPWHALTAPAGTKPAAYTEMLTHLQRLAEIGNRSRGRLQLPDGWYFDQNKVNADLINRLTSISNMSVDDEDNEPSPTSDTIPDIIA